MSALNACWMLATLPALSGLAQDDAQPAGANSQPSITFREDVVYGRVHVAALAADVAYPESKEKLPAIISVHGGRGRVGHKRDVSTINVQQTPTRSFLRQSVITTFAPCSTT